MTKIRYKSASISENPQLNAPKFHFSQYEVGRTYNNNDEIIDFVTDGNSLYVCQVNAVTTSHENIAEQEGFLKLVSQGPQGVRGPRGEDGDSAVTPRIDVNFDDDQLRVKVNGETKALSPSLTGPTWKPVLEDNLLTWELTDDRYMPESIDLMNLRPIQERPLLLRTNSDNTKRSDESSGPANFIQWKYEGDEYWTNLISISELMNLTLAGVSIWQNSEGKWHFGHKEVVRANYASDKNGRKIISNVKLGDILFDAGELPFVDNSTDTPDYSVDIDLIYQRIAELEGVVVKSVNHNLPDRDGNVQIEIPETDLDGYATEDWVREGYQPKGPYLTQHQSLAGLVKSVKVNGTVHNPDASTGQVDLGTIGGSSTPVDTSDCIKAITINNERKTPVNGEVSFTISVGGNSLFDIRLRSNRYLEKTTDGTNWTTVLDLNTISGGQGCERCWTEEDIIALIDGRLSGVIPTDYLTQEDLDDYITRSELSNYATESWVLDKIAQALNGQLEIEYFRTFTLYKRSDSRTQEPDGPLDGVWEWNITEGQILADTSQHSGWDNHPQNATPEAPYLWMATATFSSLTSHEVKPSNATTAWTKVCLTGENGLNGSNGFDGTDGADGNGVEFIFTLVRDINDKSAVDTPVAPVGQGEDDIPEGWEDHPQGIGYYLPSNVTTTLTNLGNEETLFGLELASMRSSVNGEWTSYCEPFIWSMWGEDGVDGDGVEYIFFIADEDTVEIDTTSKKIILPRTYYFSPNSPNFIPTDQEKVDALGDSYQINDWVSVRNNGWRDNPFDVDENQPFEFVSIRRYHDGTGWGPFTEPVLWSHYGGITVNPTETVYQYGGTYYSPYKCFAFYRANEEDNTIDVDLSEYDVEYDFSAFGTQENPNPTYSDLTTEQKNLYYENPQDYTKTVRNGTTLNIIWHDTVPSGSGQLWLITNHISDEAQSSDTGWTTPCRWGDDIGFQVEYSNSDDAERVYLNPALLNNYTLNKYSGNDEEREALWEADVEANGFGEWSDTVQSPIYMATCVFSNGSWSNWTVAKIKGEQGEPGEGLPGTPGSDGNAIEFVYYRTKGAEPGIEVVNELERGTYDPEDASVRNKTDKDPERDKFFPAVSIGTKTDGDYWHDHPTGVDEIYTHEWVATRTSAIQDGKRYWTSNFSIALWSKFGADGRDGDGIEYVFWGLSEEQNSQINCTWPTQKVSNSENGGCNVAPNRKDVPANRSISDPEYLPAILINNAPVQATDDNPGIENYAYVYASRRKYNGSTKSWGEFSEIKLWNEQNNQELESIILDIKDDSHTIGVDSDGRILDRYMSRTYSTDALYLYRNLVLLNCGNVYVQGSNDVDVLMASLSDNSAQTNVYEKTSNSVTITSNNVTATITPYYAWKYEDSLHSTIELKVEFSKVGGQNPILSDAFDIIVKVNDSTNMYTGSDVMRLVPRQITDDLTLLRVPGTQRTSEEGAGDYSDDEFTFYGYYGDSYTPLSLLERTHFYFKYDNQENWSEFYIPSNNQQLAALRNNVDGKREVTRAESHFYFDRSGNYINSSTNAFYEIWLYNRDFVDNIHGEWTNWSMQAFVHADAFVASEDYPIDELYFGIGFDGEILDDANVHIIYPGKNGQPGQPGQPGEPGKYKKELYCLGTTSTYDGKWQSSYASTGATISTLTSTPNAWSETKPTVTSSKPHIWMTRADVTIGSESTQTCIWEEPTRITPVDGNVTHTYEHTYEYLAGTIMRTSDWSSGVNNTTKYWDGNTRVITENGVESASSTEEGIKYLDVVSVVSNGKTSWYKCIQNHAKRSTNPATDTSYWSEFSIMGDAAFHNLLVENAAYIENLTSKQVVITDNNNIVAGMTSGTVTGTDLDGEVTPGNIRIWAGATENGNLATAPFTVDKDGKLVSDDAEITGTIHAESGSIDGTLTIGADGELVSSITTSEGVVQTTVSATEIKNSYTDNSTYAFETKIAEGKINVYNDFAGDKLRSKLGPDDLQFYSQEGSGGVTVTEAVTTPIIQEGVYAGEAFLPIFHIVQVTALPADPNPGTLYIIVS